MEDADIWKGSIYATNVYVSTAVREFDIDHEFSDIILELGKFG
jgi:hypothetical protein